MKQKKKKKEGWGPKHWTGGLLEVPRERGALTKCSWSWGWEWGLRQERGGPLGVYQGDAHCQAEKLGWQPTHLRRFGVWDSTSGRWGGHAGGLGGITASTSTRSYDSAEEGVEGRGASRTGAGAAVQGQGPSGAEWFCNIQLKGDQG